MSPAISGAAVLFQSTLSMRRATEQIASYLASHNLFQSTLSMRRATEPVRQPTETKTNFNPRSP